MSYSAGISGVTTTGNISYGSGSSSGGYATFNSPNPPGVLPGSECVPNLSTSTKTVVDTTSAGSLCGWRCPAIHHNYNGVQRPGGKRCFCYRHHQYLPDELHRCQLPGGRHQQLHRDRAQHHRHQRPRQRLRNDCLQCNHFLFWPAPGTTITNTATITNPGGAGATPVAPVVTVTGTVAPTGRQAAISLARYHYHRAP